MRKMVLVLDESGEKQYSNKQESKPFEFGIMAGVFLTEIEMEALSVRCNHLFSPYAKFFSSGKRHITNVEPEIAQALRNDVVSLFQRCRLRWFYEAIYSQGFYENFHDESRLGYMTYGGVKKHLLHAKLFKGMLNKSIDLLLQGGTELAHINVITDRVDKNILKMFEVEAKDSILTWLGRDKVETFSVYDYQKKIVKEVQLSSKITLEGVPKIDSLTYKISCEDSDLTFLVDILVGMTRYYIKQSSNGSYVSGLNSAEVLSMHPLKNLVITSGVDGQFSDRIYCRSIP